MMQQLAPSWTLRFGFSAASLLLGSVLNVVVHADERLFVERLYPAMIAAQCNLCHNDNGVAAGTELEFPDSSAAPEQIAAFGLSLMDLIDGENPKQTRLYLKPTNIEEHSGGERLQPGSDEAELLLSWIRDLQALSDDEVAAARVRIEAAQELALEPLTIRRLTHSQYNHAVRDLLGDLSQPANNFPPEDFVGGYTNQMAGQQISPLLAEAYGKAAERLAARAFRGSDTLGLFSCESDAVSDACVSEFIRSFGLRAFRRPLSTGELALYRQLFQDAIQAGETALDGGQLVVETMLQSPNFLFQIQRGPGGSNEQYELATRLAFFLWDTAPSPEILQLAADGRLATKEHVETLARQMLRDPRAQASMEEFLAQWLRFDRVLGATRDRRKFAQFTPELAEAMVEETKRLFMHLVWNDQNFMEFFSANYTFVSSELAKLYALPSPASEFAKVEYPTDSGRAGVLGHASFLVATSKATETSPTERGLFVRNHFLGQVVPAPPPGVNTVLPEITDDSPMTNSQRLAIHLNSEACASCHRLIDPIGIGLEHYNAIGALETTLRFASESNSKASDSGDTPRTIELDIDSSGYIQGIQDSEFSTPRELAEILANNDACQRCIVKQLFRYAFGRQETAGDQKIIDDLLEQFRVSNFRFR